MIKINEITRIGKIVIVIISMMIILFGKAMAASFEYLIKHADQVESYDQNLALEDIESGYNVIDGVLFKGSVLFRYHGLKKTKEYSIPNGTTAINVNAFSGLKDHVIDYLNIPESCCGLGFGDDYVVNFMPMHSIANFRVDENNPYFSSSDGLLLSKSGNILLLYPDARSEKEIIIPNGITSIGEYAFSGSEAQNIIFPSSVTSIRENAFSDMPNIKDIMLNEGLSSLGKEAFSGCSALEKVYLPDSLVSIDCNAFAACDSLKSIELPSHLLELGSYVFHGTCLQSLTLPASLQYIGSAVCLWGTSSVDVFSPMYYVYPDSYALEWAIEGAGAILLFANEELLEKLSY